MPPQEKLRSAVGTGLVHAEQGARNPSIQWAKFLKMKYVTNLQGAGVQGHNFRMKTCKWRATIIWSCSRSRCSRLEACAMVVIVVKIKVYRRSARALEKGLFHT